MTEPFGREPVHPEPLALVVKPLPVELVHRVLDGGHDGNPARPPARQAGADIRVEELAVDDIGAALPDDLAETIDALRDIPRARHPEPFGVDAERLHFRFQIVRREDVDDAALDGLAGLVGEVIDQPALRPPSGEGLDHLEDAQGAAPPLPYLNNSAFGGGQKA